MSQQQDESNKPAADQDGTRKRRPAETQLSGTEELLQDTSTTGTIA